MQAALAVSDGQTAPLLVKTPPGVDMATGLTSDNTGKPVCSSYSATGYNQLAQLKRRVGTSVQLQRSALDRHPAAYSWRSDLSWRVQAGTWKISR